LKKKKIARLIYSPGVRYDELTISCPDDYHLRWLRNVTFMLGERIFMDEGMSE
jgi:hypothetical protein